MTTSRIKLRKNSFSDKPAKSGQALDVFLKVFPVAVMVFGMLAWVSGAAYDAGFWGMGGLGSGLTEKSAQQTALTGFIGAFRTWVIGTGIIGLIGLILYFSSVSVEKKDTPRKTHWLMSFKVWLNAQSRYILKFDKDTSVVGLSLMVAGYFIFFCLITPLVFWSLGAYFDGQEQFKRSACSVRLGNARMTSIKTHDGTEIKGRVIDRSENLSIILDKTALHVVNLQEKPELQYSVPLPSIDCGVNN